MCTPLAKLAIGLSATMATAFYYLAAAPPASAVNVCGPNNFSSECAKGKAPSPPSAATSSPASLRNPTVLEAPVVAPSPPESPVPLVVDPVQQEPPQPPPSPVPQVVAPPPPSPVPQVVAPPPPESGLVPEPPPIVSPVPQVVDPPPIVSPEPLWVEPTVESSPAPTQEDPIRLWPVTEPQAAPALNFTNIYIAPTPVRTTAIPEPGTVVALLLTGAGIICSARKRNKQVGQQR